MVEIDNNLFKSGYQVYERLSVKLQENNYYYGDLHEWIYDSDHQEELNRILYDRISKMHKTNKMLEISAAIHSNYYDIFCHYLPALSEKAPNVIIHHYCINTEHYGERKKPSALIELLKDKPLGDALYLEAKYRHPFKDGTDIEMVKKHLNVPIRIAGALVMLDSILEEIELT